jgi:DNA-binding GntR family transcriptional regulator
MRYKDALDAEEQGRAAEDYSAIALGGDGAASEGEPLPVLDPVGLSAENEAVRHWAALPPQLDSGDVVGVPLSHYVAQHIRGRILQGSLRPGNQLVESTLANQLHLSRGPVRDALKQLEREGLVALVPRRGTFVSRLDKSDVWDIATLRAVLEGLAARILAERKDEAAAERLEVVLKDMAAVGDENPVRFATLDLSFHEVLVKATGHKRLVAFWTNLRTQIWMFIRETRLGGLSSASSAIEIHRAILDAIRAGDAPAAEGLTRSHSESSGRQLEAHDPD